MSIKPKTNYLATITTAAQIANHPLNNSKSKQLFSFSKASRFARNIKKPNCSVAFYDLPTKQLHDQRAFSMGARQRTVFPHNKKHIPSPSAYFPKNKHMEKSRSGFSFGKPKNTNDRKRASSQKFVGPGPGSYNISESLVPKKSFSFRIKNKTNKIKNKEIGPGLYKIPNTLNPEGKGLVSKFKSTPGFRFVPPANKSRVNKQTDTPAFYDDKLGINKLGKYFYSKFKNSGVRSFGKAVRSFNGKNKNLPGPGTYIIPSDFGIYQSSKVAER